MNDVTTILNQLEQGDDAAADSLLELVYDELRRLAASKMSQEKPGQTLTPTALVHEAYLRLVETEHPQNWKHRNHFIATAAEAMRRILIERARRKGRVKHGGEWQRVQLDPNLIGNSTKRTDLLELDAALTRLEEKDTRKAELVKLRYFAGMTTAEAAQVLDVSVATAERDWAYARVWLLRELKVDEDEGADKEAAD
jgi:RNA polymerase sigma factor (TIGR02999 family)